MGSIPGDTSGKEPSCPCIRCKRPGFNPWVGKIPGGGPSNLLHYSCLENPWMEEPGGLQSMGSQRVKHDWSDSAVARRRQVACFLLPLNFLSHHSEVQGYCLALHPRGRPGVKPILGPAVSQVSICPSVHLSQVPTSALGTGALSPHASLKKTHPRWRVWLETAAQRWDPVGLQPCCKWERNPLCGRREQGTLLSPLRF